MDTERKQDDDSMFRCFKCEGKEFDSLGEFERHQLEFHTNETRNTKSQNPQRQSRNATEAMR